MTGKLFQFRIKHRGVHTDFGITSAAGSDWHSAFLPLTEQPNIQPPLSAFGWMKSSVRLMFVSSLAVLTKISFMLMFCLNFFNPAVKVFLSLLIFNKCFKMYFNFFVSLFNVFLFHVFTSFRRSDSMSVLPHSLSIQTVLEQCYP